MSLGSESNEPRVRRTLGSLRRHALISFGALSLLFGGMGGSFHFIKIGGAVIASGQFVVESNSKKVQHSEGGIVAEIFVRNGEPVRAGDAVLRLDDTVVRANLSILSRRLDELTAQEARLHAERDGSARLLVPLSLSSRSSESDVSLILSGQSALLEARRASLEGQKEQLSELNVQYGQRIVGLEAQRDAKKTEVRLVRQELKDLSGLEEQGLVLASRITALKREEARLNGEWGSLVASISAANEAINENNLRIIQLDKDFRSEVLESLQEVRTLISQLTEQKIAAEDRMRRVSVVSPQNGTVHELSVHTEGGVISPGETVMLIVPDADRLVVEAQVSPLDVDQVYVGQDARIRLPGLSMRSTPELHGKVIRVSADLIEDRFTGLSYYTARLQLNEGESSRLQEGDVLVPGMPVEAFITTEERTILSYLVRPVSDQIAHAFREN